MIMWIKITAFRRWYRKLGNNSKSFKLLLICVATLGYFGLKIILVEILDFIFHLKNQMTECYVSEPLIKELVQGPNTQNCFVDQSDPVLVRYVRDNFLKPPSKLPYNLDSRSGIGKRTFSQTSQDLSIIKLFHKKKNGFFIECGAVDGEYLSNTLILEKDYGWTGLLIEANPQEYKKLLRKGRKSWSSNACLSVSKYPEKVRFYMGPDPVMNTLFESNAQGTYDNNTNSTVGFYIEQQCIPLYTYLLALGINQVDYFSLDVEGADFLVLQTIPFDKIDFKVIETEVNKYSELQLQQLLEFMMKHNYTFYGAIDADYIFVHNSILPFI